MDLSYYNNEIDKILWDVLGDNFFIEEDKTEIIDLITNTVYQYDKRVKPKNLSLIIRYIIDLKYEKRYVYDTVLPINTYDKNIDSVSEHSTSSCSLPCDKIGYNDNEEKYGDNASLPNTYFNSEIKFSTIANKTYNNYKDLVSHRHDYRGDKYKEDVYIKRRKRIVVMKKIPQHEQKSQGWLDQRAECLTATAVATAIDEDPHSYPANLLLDKAGRGEPFIENVCVHHGKKYEDVGNMFYSFRNNVKMAEYGLIQHAKYPFIGASPDGICEKQRLDSDNLSKLVGRLLEIKFPYSRFIKTVGDLDGVICPHYYFVQVQTQLFVTEMDECDFLQCKIEEYNSWEDFVADSNPQIPGLSIKTNLEKGCLIQLLPRAMAADEDKNMCLFNAKYIYPPRLHMSPEEIEKWVGSEILHFNTHELSEKYLVDRVMYWRLSKVACNLIKYNAEWFESKIPLLKQFWDYVLYYRANPEKLDKLEILIKEIGAQNTKEIFARVHKDYMSANPNSTYKKLYQEKTEWRIKYDAIHAKYANKGH